MEFLWDPTKAAQPYEVMLQQLMPAIANLESLAVELARASHAYKVSQFGRLSKLCTQLFKIENDSRDFKRLYSNDKIEGDHRTQSIDLKKQKQQAIIGLI